MQSPAEIAGGVQATLWELTPEDHTVCAAPDPEPCTPEPKPAAPVVAPQAPPGALTWDEALERYTLHLRARRCSARTIYCQGRTVLKLKDALLGQAPTPAHVTLDQLRRYQLGLLNRRQAASTVAKVTCHLRSFFRFLHLDELLPLDPSSRLESPRVPPRPPGDVLSPEDMQRLLQATAESKCPLLERAVLEALYCTGVRRAELLALDLFDLDHKERTLLVRAGKGEKPRVLPITPICYEALSRYLEHGRPALERTPTEALFVGPKGKRLCQVYLARMLHALGERAGVSKQVTPHTFRRSCATGLLKNGTNLRVIQAILGHSSLETTSVYLCLSPEEIRSEVLSRHPRERFEA